MSKLDSYFDRAGQSGSNSFDPIEYPEKVILKKDVPNVLRFVDFSETGITRIRESWCLCDDGKQRAFVIETEEEGPSLLMKMLGDLENYGKGGYLETIKKDNPSGGKATSFSIHAAANPALYTKIAKNGDETGKSGSWRGRDMYVTNVIQRWADVKDGVQFFFCKEKKHTKLIEINSQAFTSIKVMIANDGAPEAYDVAYYKSGEGTNTKHNIVKAGSIVPGVVVGPLAEEEKNYTRYSLKDDVKNSPSLYVLKYLRSTIEDVDKVMGTNWIQQHEERAEQEKAAFAASRGEDTSKDTSRAVTTPQPQPTPQAMPQQTQSQAQPAVRGAAVAPETRQPVVTNTFLCKHCNTMIPDTDIICSACGKQVKAPCSKCNFPFSLFESVCPNCKHEYPMTTPS